jgi:cytochrome c-type biogenesis protein CcmH
MTGANLFWFLAGLTGASAAFLFAGSWLRRSKLIVLGVAFTALVAAGLYHWLMNPHPGAASHTSHAPAAADAPPRQAAAMESESAKLESRLAAGGGSDSDWDLLAQAYEFQGRAQDAAAARHHHLAATPDPAASAPTGPRTLIEIAADAQQRGDYPGAHAAFAKLAAAHQMTADTWADYADVTATLQGKLSGEPEGYVQAALALDSKNPKALWLKASLEHETHHYSEAIVTWQKLVAVLGPESSDAALIAANLAEDQKLATSAGAAAGDAAPSAFAVRGRVVLADALRNQASSGVTLFIVAKSVNSPGAPVAVLRTTTGAWPVKFELNDSMAMLPERKLSTAGKVTIEARVSKSGLAARQAGDLFGESAPLDPASAAEVDVVIARVLD